MKRNILTSQRAFTLTELLAVIVALAILACVFLPALAREQNRPAVVLCKENYRQWGVMCNLYANDDAKGAFPSFPLPSGTGNNIWDVSTTMISVLKPYGLTVPMWFCPARPDNFDQANQRCVPLTGHDIQNLDDLKISVQYSSTLSYGVIYHHLWIPRRGGSSVQVVPNTWNVTLNTNNPNANEIFQWPSSPTDPTVSKAPILSDRLFAGGAGSTNLSNAVEGHMVNGKVDNVNLLYGDGRVEERSSTNIQWRWKSGAGYASFY